MSQAAETVADRDVQAQGDAAGDIVVTASALASIDRRPILETPRTVQAVSGELVANTAPTSILSVTKFLPGIASTVSYNDVRPQYIIRGIGAEVRRNGLLLTRVAIPIEDIGAVELLQGPGDVTQGGNKTPGGVLNYVSKRAVGASFERVTLAVNDLGNVLGQADINLGSEGGRFGFRANVGLEHIELPNQVYGRRAALALAGRVDLTPELTLDVNGYVNDASRHNQLIIVPTFLTGAIPPVNYDNRYGQRWSRDNYARQMAEARLTGSFADDWSVLLQGSFAHGRDLTYDGFINPLAPDGTATVRASKVLQHNYDLSARAAVTRDFDLAPWFANRLSLIGDYYRLRLENAITNVNLATPINFFTNRDLPDPNVVLKPKALARINTTSGYGIADEATLFDRLTISVGLKRYIVDSRQYDFNNNGAFLNDVEQRAWLPNASALLRITPGWTAYFSYFKAFEPGTIVNFQFLNQGDLLPPRRSETYEVGTKAQLGGMLLSLTGFRFTRPSTIIIPGPSPTGLSIQSQSGAARYKGIDFSATGKPVPQLTLIGGFSILDAVVTRTDQPATLGKFVTDAPKFQGSLYAEYEASAGLFLTGGVFTRGRSQLNAINTIQVPGYTTFDAGVRYEGSWRDHRYRLSLLAENIGDRLYFAGSSFGSPKLGGPRTVKAIASYDF